MRVTIEIDDELPEEAKTKKQLINLSLREFARKKRLEHLAALYGSGVVAMTNEELEEYRAG